MAEDSVLGRMRLESKFVPGNVGTASWPIKACHARENPEAQVMNIAKKSGRFLMGYRTLKKPLANPYTRLVHVQNVGC